MEKERIRIRRPRVPAKTTSLPGFINK